MDTLALYGLQYHACHGVYEKERSEGNDFEVDLIFSANLKSAAESDNLSATIDYEQAEQMVREVMEGDSVQLLETLVSKIGSKLFAHFFLANELKVCIRKMRPPLQTPARYTQFCSTWKRSS